MLPSCVLSFLIQVILISIHTFAKSRFQTFLLLTQNASESVNVKNRSPASYTKCPTLLPENPTPVDSPKKLRSPANSSNLSKLVSLAGLQFKISGPAIHWICLLSSDCSFTWQLASDIPNGCMHLPNCMYHLGSTASFKFWGDEKLHSAYDGVE